MAQTSSAAREPSMEEILASIRRIIEDSDVSRKAVPDAPALAPRGEVAAFRRPEPVEEKPAAAPSEDEKPAMMRGIFTEEPVLRGSIPAPSAPEADEEDEVVLDAQNDDCRTQSALETPVQETEMRVETPFAEDVAEPEGDMMAEAEQPAAAAAVGEAEAMTPAGSPILSQAVERQVAEAFGDLNHAVHAGPRRSFDEIAAELLRPMLQDWFDRNLPALVERLVREEIERVVRGGR